MDQHTLNDPAKLADVCRQVLKQERLLRGIAHRRLPHPALRLLRQRLSHHSAA
jgi:hypothetical protein